MTNSLILAVNMKSASEYARLAGLQKHTWRWASSADAIVGSRPTHIYELPCFARKGNRFGILVEVRSAVARRKAEHVQVTEDDLEALRVAAEPTAPEHSDKTVGEQLDIWDALEEPRPEIDLGGGLKAEVGLDGSVMPVVPVSDGFAEALAADPKPKPAKKAAAKKPAAKPAADDFFGI